MNEKQKLETAIEVLQLKKAMVMKQATEKQFHEVESEIQKLNQEEKKVYENDSVVIQKVLTQYIEEVKEYMEVK